MENLLEMIADDRCAMTYQTMGQYRSALLKFAEHERKEFNLLIRLYEACQESGQARKHECPGFDCAICNTTPMFSAMNDLEQFYNPDPPNGSVMPNGSEV